MTADPGGPILTGMDSNDERIRFSLRDGNAVLTCKEHPHWHPDVTGDTIAKARDKADRHIADQHKSA